MKSSGKTYRVGDLLRRQLKFDGLIYSDSMKMAAITKMASPSSR